MQKQPSPLLCFSRKTHIRMLSAANTFITYGREFNVLSAAEFCLLTSCMLYSLSVESDQMTFDSLEHNLILSIPSILRQSLLQLHRTCPY